MGKHERIDITGNKYGRLTVISYAYTKNKRAYWFCQCDCGNPELFIAMGKTIKNGLTKSCGCLIKENIRKIKPILTSNNYIFKDNYVILEIIKLLNNQKSEVFIDTEEYYKVKKYNWWINHNGYVISQNGNNTIFLHRYILNYDSYSDLVGDHKNGNQLDNRKENLRHSTCQTNGYNNKMFKNNTSGITGVWFNKRDNKWIAEIKFEKKKLFLKQSSDKYEAITYREIAELYLFREYSRHYEELKEKYKNINIVEFVRTKIHKIYNLTTII